ncbi:acetylcholine receptor subunit beta-like 1 [Watersipora subatra]|uniref:acetylcholine receptor subunit beta-like 1 n=1 Tax=Watersipora subatra TaxID=2589382 RepID=UPI00355C9E6B
MTILAVPRSMILGLTLLLGQSLGSDSEHRLVQDLFDKPGYNPLIRPVENISDPIEVSLGVTLFQVITVEERTQVMKTNNWIRMGWKDYQLKWNPEEYGGITEIRLPCAQIWKPDIVLLNNADGKYEQSFCCHTVIGANGTIMWIPPSIYKSSCTIDVDASQVQLKLDTEEATCEVSNYVYSGTWDLMKCPATLSTTKKNSEIQYDIVLRRKTLFYTVNLLTPCVLISFLSVLTFYLPADAQEKVTLCISILLALVVFLLLVSKSLPPTSVTMPLISKYLFFTFIMNIVTVVVSVAIININFRSPRTYKMPRWIRIIFLQWLPIILFMKRPEHEEKYLRWKERKLAMKEASSTRPKANGATTGIEMNEFKISDAESNHTFRSATTKETLPVSIKAAKAIEAIEFITEHLKRVDDYDEICNDWRYIAGVIDRFLLYIFLIITIAGTISIIVNAPNIFEHVDQKAIIDELMNQSS